MFVPISSAKTRERASSDRATITLRRLFAIRRILALPHSFFSAEAHPLREPPQGRFAKSLAGQTLKEVAPLFDGSGGLVRMSSSRSLFVASSALGDLPPPLLGLRDPPWLASLA